MASRYEQIIETVKYNMKLFEKHKENSIETIVEVEKNK
jgi:hypothetical protein